jgi:HK97 family phage prohead protease
VLFFAMQFYILNMATYKFILNDETIVNSYGFALSNAGMKAERFKANPVLLYGHDYNKLFGRWSNLAVVDGKIIAEAEFDSEDAEALKAESKVKNGFLKGCSVGIIINEMVALTVDGKLIPVATDWELMEASVVPVPSNAGSVRLYSKEMLALNADEIQLNVKELLKNIKSQKMEFKISEAALAALGLTAQATAEAVSAAILALDTKQKDAAATLLAAKQAAAEALVADAVAKDATLAAQKDSLVAFALQNYEAAKVMLQKPTMAEAPTVTLAGMVTNNSAVADTASWDFAKWQKEKPKELAAIRVSENAKYEALRAAYKK